MSKIAMLAIVWPKIEKKAHWNCWISGWLKLGKVMFKPSRELWVPSFTFYSIIRWISHISFHLSQTFITYFGNKLSHTNFNFVSIIAISTRMTFQFSILNIKNPTAIPSINKPFQHINSSTFFQIKNSIINWFNVHFIQYGKPFLFKHD